MASSLSPHAILLVYWLLLVALSAFFLRLACGLCGVGLPTWRRAIVSVFVVAFLTYLVIDFTAYLILRSMQDVLVQIPPWYGYNWWFREPIGLKWFVISHVGPLRYLPFVFGLCAAGVLQVAVLQAQVTFRFGLLIALLQWGATFVAGYVLALVFGVALSTAGWAPQPPPVAQQSPAQARTARTKAPRGPRGKEAAGADASSLAMFQQEGEAALREPREYLSRAGTGLKAYADTLLEQITDEMEPATRYLPQPVRNWLDGGGWWVVFGIAAFLALLWLRSILLRLVRVLSKPRRKRKQRGWKKVAVNLKENLRMIGDASTEEGDQRLVVNGLPARLRLVILAQGSSNAGELTPEMADRVLDWIKPGLAEVCSEDYPRVRVWPPFYSAGGFETAVAGNVAIPAEKGERSPWVVVTGQVRMGRALVRVALGLHTDEVNNLRHVKVKGDHWLDVLGVKGAKQPASVR